MPSVLRFFGHPRMAWLAVVPPAGLLAVLIVRNAVDVPFWDDWFLISDTLLRARSGDLHFRDLAAQHNDSRCFFPRLLFLVVGLLSRGDGRWLLLVTFSLACAVSYAVFLLARSTMRVRPWSLWGLLFLAGLLIFSPMSAEAWLWSSYVGLEPVACLAATLVVFRSGLGPGKKVAIGGVLCTVATFSYANGLSTWVLAAPVLVISVGRRWLGWWTLGLLLNATAFFHGYTKPSSLDGLQVLRWGHFVLAFLGAPLGLGRLWIATVMGALLLALFLVAGAYLALWARDEDLRRRMAPWLSLGGYALLSGMAAGAGRSAMSVTQTPANRYIPFSLYLALALLFLIPIVLDHARARGHLRAPRLLLVRVTAAACLALCLALQAGAVGVGARGMEWVGRMMRYGKTCLLFINVHPDEACLAARVLPNTAVLREYANHLDRLGYLRPGLVKSTRLGELRAPSGRAAGVFESVLDRGPRLVAAGWAGLPAAPGPADAVIVARKDGRGGWIPLEFAPVLGPRPDVAAQRGPAYMRAGWRAGLARDTLPDHPITIGAWAFDAEKGWALPLEGVHTVEAGPDAPG